MGEVQSVRIKDEMIAYRNNAVEIRLRWRGTGKNAYYIEEKEEFISISTLKDDEGYKM